MTSSDIVFSARLTPYRSLDRRGFNILIGLVGGIFFVIGMVFLTLGLWPVLGFMGLDVALVYWAFKANYKAARAYEDVEVSRRHVLLRKVNPNGVPSDHEFPQFGTRFEVERHQEIGITKMQISHRANSVELGNFLNPLDRDSFALAFQQALATAKR